MIEQLRVFFLNTVLAPVKIEYCSQTVYESLLGCCRMWEATKDERWRLRATRLAYLLKEIQQPDGGFDIGYDFNFGYWHKKGQSTSPELVGLLAFCEYDRLFSDSDIRDSAAQAVRWIERFLKVVDGKKRAIPYSPYTTEEIMVYNGTSFGCGALGLYLGLHGGSEELKTAYFGMVEYLDSVLKEEPKSPGRFWPYNDQSRFDLSDISRSKIDYYHQMQQVEVHSLAQQVSPHPLQRKFIRDAADHIVFLHHQNGGLVPYTNSKELFKGHVHLWGLASIIGGLLEASKIHPDRANEYHQVARETLDWIITYAWTGKNFAPILTNNGDIVQPCRYMVRSDAWVFNALAAAFRDFSDFNDYDVIEKCYKKMEEANFSGPESHASSVRLRFFSSTLKLVKDFSRVFR